MAHEDLSDGELLREVLRSFFEDLRVAVPGRVESYDASKQTCSVKPMLKRHISDGDGGTETESDPVLQNVPVAFSRTSNYFISFPLAKGDTVLLVICDRPISQWRKTGEESDPGEMALHTLKGAVAIPCLFHDSQALQSADGTNMVLGRDGTPAAQIEITPSQVHLGGGAEFVALANLVKARIDTLQAAHDAHVHPAGTPNTGAPTSLIGSLGAVAAQNVKAT